MAIKRVKPPPPSGDKHDYLSYSRYWWPDPEKNDGLPYIRRDGVVKGPLEHILDGDFGLGREEDVLGELQRRHGLLPTDGV